MAVKYTQRKALLHRRRMNKERRAERLEARMQRWPAIVQRRRNRRPLFDLLLLIEGPGYKRTDLGLISMLLQAMRGKGYKREVQAG